MLIHIDCNSFFASCEIAANPELEGKPVVVANENEAGGGVLLALNDEAKALGLKRGSPVFQVRRLLELNNVQVCRVDHKKYRCISHDIMEAVQQQDIVVDFVQYSVDEFFGSLPLEDPDEVRRYVQLVKDHITTTTHIPVSCGCSQSYTLAKVATHFAKHYKGYGGICVLTLDKREKALSMLPIADVWGIGRQNRKKLQQLGIVTALDFVHRGEQEIKDLFSVSGMRTYRELKGIPCIDLKRSALQRSIMQSRTFGYMITEKEPLEKYIRTFASICAVKLREQQGICGVVSVFVATNRHRQDLLQYSNSATTKFVQLTSDTPVIVKAAVQMLDSIYRKGFQYKQAGVVLGNIREAQGQQLDLFAAPQNERRRKLMQVADSINAKFGDDKLHFS